MILQVALLGGGILAEGAEELTGVEMELHVLLVVAAVSGLVLAVWTRQRFWTIVDLAGVARHLMLIGCQVVTALTLERTLTYNRKVRRSHVEERIMGQVRDGRVSCSG